MTLIPNIKQAWKMFSIQAQALNAALLVSWQTLPTTLQTILPVEYLLVIAVGLLVLGMIGRMVKQNNVTQ
jgi:hypothetical protein